MTVVRFPDGRRLRPRDHVEPMTAVIPDMFGEDGNLEALFAEGAALAAPPEPWNLDVAACLGPTVEVTQYRPFAGQPPRDTRVWAVVDRQAVAGRLVEPAPMTDPALVDRDVATD